MATVKHLDRTSTSPDTLSFRRFAGPLATEFHFLCRPGGEDLEQATRRAYRDLHEALSLEGQGLECVVEETVFFRDIGCDLDAFLTARSRLLHELKSAPSYRPASTFIEQPPLEAGARLQILATAVIPHSRDRQADSGFRARAACGCDVCEDVSIRGVLLGEQKMIYAGNLVGLPGNAFDEAFSMFEAAEEILEQERADFRSVVRTWIYFRDMERDYAEFNRARREFFKRRQVTLPPASTGIGGNPFPREHNFVMSFHAIQSPRPVEITRMATPWLMEAPEYGSDFSRGVKVVDANKVTLYVSGTASVDRQGRTAHRGHFEAQADRMLFNVWSLLKGQGASFDDVVSATTYVKRLGDAPLLHRLLQMAGLESCPHALVDAEVCRPDLLCEMEAIAVLPRASSSPHPSPLTQGDP